MLHRARSLTIALFLGCAIVLVPVAARGVATGGFPVVDLRVAVADAPLGDEAPPGAALHQASALALRKGRVAGVVLPLREPRRGVPSDPPLESAFLSMDRWLARPDDFASPGCLTSSERIETWFAFRGAAELGAEPAKTGLWTLRGVRAFGLTSGEDNSLATSWTNGAALVGLTDQGRGVARRVFQSGGLLDVGESSDATRDDVFQLASQFHAPVVALSANARALADDPRNLSDAELYSIGASGGVVGIGFDEHLVVRGHTAGIHDVVRHIQHVAKISGIDHVAIASGFGTGIRPADGLEDASKFPDLARALLASGFTDDAVNRIFFKNALRVLCSSSRH